MKKEKKNKILIFIIALAIIGIIGGVSFAYWTNRTTQQTINKVSSNCLKVDLTDVTDAINLENAYPLTDEQAENLTPYTFKIANVCSLDVAYDVQLDIMDVENRLNSGYIDLDFNGQGKKLISNYPTATPSYDEADYTAIDAIKLTSGQLRAGEEVTYTIKLWMDESVTINDDAMNKNFISKIVVNAVMSDQLFVYTEGILNGADPVLADNLIPVTIADDGTVTKADVYEEWYNYGNKVWANAVILLDKSITYQNNETIPESNIESYFVWIPKYSYQIWDLGTYSGLTSLTTKNQTINIKFGTTNTSDSVSGECTTPGTSGGSGNCAVGEYMTPPAFTTMGTNGIWVGKFETGYKGASSTSAAQVDSSDSTKVQIKPNTYSWRNITVGNIFATAYNYQREMDSHMMKNTEWAVAAMLSHTQYGKGTEVWINNNGNYVTGCVGASASASGVSGCTNTYNSTNGFQGSSTGNISGIYDMSGGAWEYMAGYINGNTGSAGITPSNYNAKYFDVYSSSSTETTYQYRILGDLTGELGPFQDSSGYRSSWYSDYAAFVYSSEPWFGRGGYCYHGAGAGAFLFNRNAGGTYGYVGFRVVLAV